MSTSVTVTGPVQLFNLRLLDRAPQQRGQACGSICRAVVRRVGVQLKCQCKRLYHHSISRSRLTSFLAFLRRLGLLGEAGVQPGRGLAVVTEIQKKGDGALGAGKKKKRII